MPIFIKTVSVASLLSFLMILGVKGSKYVFSLIIHDNKDLKTSNILLWIREAGNGLLKGLCCQNETGSFVFLPIFLLNKFIERR